MNKKGFLVLFLFVVITFIISQTSVRKQPEQNEEEQELLTIDWQEYGVVTVVKNQQICLNGSWVFGATAAIEGLMGITNIQESVSQDLKYYKQKRLKKYYNALRMQSDDYIQQSLSEQQILDCTPNQDNCTQGSPQDAYNFTLNHGIVPESLLHYIGKKEMCPISSKSLSAFNITGYSTTSGCSQLKELIFQQPVVVRINYQNIGDYYISEEDKQTALLTNSICGTPSSNSSSFLKDENNSEAQQILYQYVLVTAYDGTKFTVKNSEGSIWGYLGYAWIDAVEDNSCGICEVISYPTV